MPFKFVVAGATTLIATGVAFYKRHSNCLKHGLKKKQSKLRRSIKKLRKKYVANG